MQTFRKKDYAKEKEVSAARISALVKDKKLLTTIQLGMEVIIDCPENDKHFARPAHNRKKTEEKE
jgi:hypothetical protein